MKRRLFVLWLVVMWQPVSAQDVTNPPLDEAMAAYVAGNFLQAADLAAHLETAQGDALAARAVLAHAVIDVPEAEGAALLQRGLALAESAIARDPSYVEGLLQKAVALGYIARLEGVWKAHNRGRGNAAKQVFEQALALAPDNAWAWSVRGAWHAEIRAFAGGFLATLTYGASKKKALRSFAKAVALDPKNPVLFLEYAKALIRLKEADDNVPTARQLLETAITLPPANMFDRNMQQRAHVLLEAYDLDSNAREAVLDSIDPFRGADKRLKEAPEN